MYHYPAVDDVRFTLNGTNLNDEVVPHYYRQYDWVVSSASR